MQTSNDNQSKISLEYWYIFITAIITAIILSALCVKFKSLTTVKLDTLLLIMGNFGIAYWISTVINKKHKDNELKIDNCFEELDNLLKLIIELRDIINTDKFNDDHSYRLMSLLNLQIDLIGKYSFIDKKHQNELTKEYKKLDDKLTGSNTIDSNYKLPLLSIEKRILVIKSEIL